MTTCMKCGKLNPQFAVGVAASKPAGARSLVYEGDPKTPFVYTGSDKCMTCRHGTRSLLGKQPHTGTALKAWLVTVNERR